MLPSSRWSPDHAQRESNTKASYPQGCGGRGLSSASELERAGTAARRTMRFRYLMRKLSLVSLVPFISSRIHTGVMPRPDHFSALFFLDWYFGLALARLQIGR